MLGSAGERARTRRTPRTSRTCPRSSATADSLGRRDRARVAASCEPRGRIRKLGEESADVRNTMLHRVLEAFTVDAAGRLVVDTAGGAEIPFELIEEPGGRARLYCYRPLPGEFIRQRQELLAGLPSYDAAARALAGSEAVETYLHRHGESRMPADPRERAGAALRTFLGSVFAERSEFGFDPDRFELAYAELEQALYDERSAATVIAPLLGVALEPQTAELALGDGLSLVRGEALADAPTDAVWGESEEPNVLALLTVAQKRDPRPPVLAARTRFRRVLTALRLFERGGYALGPVAWARTEAGSWRTVAIGGSGRPRFITLIPASQEGELRAFCHLIARRAPQGGELAWALARFEMGCERLAPFEALSDYLLALRALLEPEGPSSGRLAQRLASVASTRSSTSSPSISERCSEMRCAGIWARICAWWPMTCWPKPWRSRHDLLPACRRADVLPGPEPPAGRRCTRLI